MLFIDILLVYTLIALATAVVGYLLRVEHHTVIAASLLWPVLVLLSMLYVSCRVGTLAAGAVKRVAGKGGGWNAGLK